ncbi:O-antigen ligase [Collimonas sp. PA-H2]|uniref:O-antigen ligase family protein n=1 Tax=Collimonas sp. PA-H2 TaxID=1881062 RepID=UPI00118148F6|nr:O-antigen ligase family protein [Collimonas sp. PA-H2]
MNAQRTSDMPATDATLTVASGLSLAVVVAVIAAISPLLSFALVPGAGFHDNQRILEIFCLVLTSFSCVALLLLKPGAKFRPLHDYRMLSFLALFFALGLASSAIAYSPRHALLEWSNLLLLVVMSSLIAMEIRDKGSILLDRILLVCGLGSAFYIFIEIINYIAIVNAGGQPANIIFVSGFDNYRFLNHVQTITLPLLGLFICRSDDSRKKIFAWVVTSVWWTLLYVSAGRGTFIGMLAGVGVTWIFLRKDALPWSRVMLWSALAGMAVYLLFYVLIPLTLGLQPFGFLFAVAGRTMENPDSGRWPLWIRAWEIMLGHPWLGAGPLHFAHFGRTVQAGAHPHNWVAQIACEWGIPAFLCLVAALALGLRKLQGVRRYLLPADRENRLTLAALLTAAVAILVDGLVSGLIVMPTSQLWIALYIGITWGWLASLRSPQAEATLRLSPVTRVFTIAGLLTLLYFLGNGLWPEIGNLKLYEEQNLQQDIYADPISRPRIWLGGYF